MSINYHHINNDNFNNEYTINTINHKNTYSGISKGNPKRSKNNLQFSSKKLDTNSLNKINFNIKNNNISGFKLKNNLSRDKLEQKSRKRIRNYIMSEKFDRLFKNKNKKNKQNFKEYTIPHKDSGNQKYF